MEKEESMNKPLFALAAAFALFGAGYVLLGNTVEGMSALTSASVLPFAFAMVFGVGGFIIGPDPQLCPVKVE